MSTRVDNLIEDIKNVTNHSINDIEEIRAIGNDDYPSNNIQNVLATGITIYDGFQNVAFLYNTKNFNLVSIVALLLDSWDDAIELIGKIIKKSLMNLFAIFIAAKRIILVNQDGNEDECCIL